MISFIKNNINAILLVCVAIVVIPIILNVVLQWQISNSVITANNDNGPSTWLVFWGAFLSAVGAFSMAYVSYTQNHIHAKVDLKKTDLNTFESRYEKADLFIRDFIETCDPSIFLGIFNDLCHTKDEIAHANCSKQITHILTIQQKITQFKSHKDRCSNKYEEDFLHGCCKHYKILYDVYYRLNNKINEIKNKNNKPTKNNLEQSLKQDYQSLYDVLRNISNIGFDFLRNLREEIENKQQEIDDLCKKL